MSVMNDEVTEAGAMLDTEGKPDGHDVVDRRLAVLMVFEAATLAVMTTLHLSGALAGGSKPFSAPHAGVSEAIIGAVLLVGAAAVFGHRANARGMAVAATVFAIAGFIVGLSFTLQGGGGIDVAYHVVLLPILVLTALGLIARPAPGPRAPLRGGEPDATPATGRRS
jgi:hypothetical protein